MTQTAKLFTNGGSQAVRLPAQFRFEGSEVHIRRDDATGDVILSRADDDKRAAWDEFFSMLNELEPGDIPSNFPFRDQGQHVERILFEDWDESGLR